MAVNDFAILNVFNVILQVNVNLYVKKHNASRIHAKWYNLLQKEHFWQF